MKHNCPDIYYSTVETLLQIACFLILLKAENIYFPFIFITNHPHNNFDLAFGHFISHLTTSRLQKNRPPTFSTLNCVNASRRSCFLVFFPKNKLAVEQIK